MRTIVGAALDMASTLRKRFANPAIQVNSRHDVFGLSDFNIFGQGVCQDATHCAYINALVFRC